MNDAFARDDRGARSKLADGLGIFCVAFGLLLNYWVVGRILSPDGHIESTWLRALVWTVDLVSVTGGLLIIRFPRYGRWALSALTPCVTIVACSVILFGLLEAVPSMIRYMPFANLHYYAVKSQYIGDDDLVLRNRPSMTFETTSFKGDEYRPWYGVGAPPLRYRVAYDRDGFRNDTEFDDADVIVLGDSFIEFGLDEEDTFTKRLGTKSGLKVKNLATSFHGPFQYLAAFKRFGLKLKPRYALFCFFEGNDIGDIQRYLTWKQGGAYGHYNLTSKNFVQRYAIVLSELVVALSETAGKVWRSPEPERRDEGHHLVRLELGAGGVPAVFSYGNETRPADVLLKTTEWNVLRDLLAEFKAICLEHDITPIVVFLPTKTHVYAPYSATDGDPDWVRIRAQQIASRHNVESALELVCRQAGVELVSFTPAFEQAAKEGRFVFYPFDSHWNSDAREIAASIMAQRLNRPIRAKLS